MYLNDSTKHLLFKVHRARSMVQYLPFYFRSLKCALYTSQSVLKKICSPTKNLCYFSINNNKKFCQFYQNVNFNFQLFFFCMYVLPAFSYKTGNNRAIFKGVILTVKCYLLSLQFIHSFLFRRNEVANLELVFFLILSHTFFKKLEWFLKQGKKKFGS